MSSRVKSRPPRWIYLLPFLGLAVISAAIGVLWIQGAHGLETRGEVTTAKVLREDSNHKGSPKIEIEFSTRDGERVRTWLSRYSSGKAGEDIQIEYDPEHPTKVQGADMPHDYSLGYVLFAVAAGLAGVGLVLGLRPGERG